MNRDRQVPIPTRAAALYRPRFPWLWFAACAAAVYATSMLVSGLLPGLAHPGAVAAGVTLDLVVVVPAAFYVFLVRRRGWPPITLVPVVVLGFVAASRLLPADQHRTLHVLEGLAAPAEALLILWIARSAHRAWRGTGGAACEDPLERLERATLALTKARVPASILATEVAVLAYGLLAWRARPHAPPGSRPFTHHRASGHAGILLGIFLVLAVEGLAVHFLLARWNPVVAWVFTLGTLYTMLWLVADHRATVLRPILVDADGVHFRAGLRVSVFVPRAAIAAVERRDPELGNQALRLTFLTAPTLWVVLSEPVWALGPYGTRRRVRALGLEPDAAEALQDALVAAPSHGTDA